MHDNATSPLPPELAVLVAGDSAGWTLPVKLPPGRLVRPNPSWVDRSSHASAAWPAYWLSDTPARAALWPQLRAAHRRSGLWPLLLQSEHTDPALPWAAGEVDPQPASVIDSHDPAVFLATVWAAWVQDQEGEDDLEYHFEDLERSVGTGPVLPRRGADGGPRRGGRLVCGTPPR